jgi:hypothetical protein
MSKILKESSLSCDIIESATILYTFQTGNTTTTTTTTTTTYNEKEYSETEMVCTSRQESSCFEKPMKNILKRISINAQYYSRLSSKLQRIQQKIKPFAHEFYNFTLHQLYDDMLKIPQNIIDITISSTIPIHIAWKNLMSIWNWSKKDTIDVKYEKAIMFLAFLNEHDSTGRGIRIMNDNTFEFCIENIQKTVKKKFWTNPKSQIKSKLKAHGFNYKFIQSKFIIQLIKKYTVDDDEEQEEDEKEEDEKEQLEEDGKQSSQKRPSKRQRTS